MAVGFRLVEAEDERAVKTGQLAEIQQAAPAEFVDLVGQVGGREFPGPQAQTGGLGGFERLPGKPAEAERAHLVARARSRVGEKHAQPPRRVQPDPGADQLGFQLVVEMLENGPQPV